MERISPFNFSGPRAFFTDISPVIFREKSDKEFYKEKVKKRLKVILLTKSKVVCGASHLTHKDAYELFKNNPILLEKNMIIPALRKDKQYVTDYLQDKKINKYLKKDMISFYERNINKVVDWELMENTKWFRKNILEALKNEYSVIRKNLSNLSEEKLYQLIKTIEEKQILFQELIIKSSSNWPETERKILLNYVNLIYHMSGARVVNCESVLPQEQYIDYSLADFSKHRTKISDEQVFIKIFIELAFELLNKEFIPENWLDTLSFEDIYYLRKPIQESSFCKKYDEIIKMSINAIKSSESNSEKLMYEVNIEEPMKILNELSNTFEKILTQELKKFMEKKYYKQKKELLKSSFSLSSVIFNFIPYISTISNFKDFLQSSREFYVNLNQTFRCKEEVNNYELYYKNKKKLLHQMIKKHPISNKNSLFEVINLLIRTVTEKMQI